MFCSFDLEVYVMRLPSFLVPFILGVFVFLLADYITGGEVALLSFGVAFVVSVGFSFMVWPRNSK